MVVVFLTFSEISILFSIVTVPSYNHTNKVQMFPFLCVLSSICYFLSFWILEVRYNYGFDLYSLISDVEYLFVYLLDIHISSLEKYLLVICTFLNWVIWFFFLLLLSFMSSPYILDINLLLYIVWKHFPILFFYFSTCWLYILLWRSFLVWCGPTCLFFILLWFRCYI